MFSLCSGYYFGTVMIEATATTLRFPPTNNSGPWWLTELKSPASKWHLLRNLFQFKRQSFQGVQQVPMKTHGITKLYLTWRLKTFQWSFTSVLIIKKLNDNLLYMTEQAFLILQLELNFWKWHVPKQGKERYFPYTVLSWVLPPHFTLSLQGFFLP